MNNTERITELINQHLNLIKNDHHKTKDGYFWIERVWNGYDGEQLIPRYQAIHHGYIGKFDGPMRYTEQAAEEDMIKFLEELIDNWQPDDWGQN